MRQIFSQNPHGFSGLRITAEDSPHRGLPPHRYNIEGFDTADNPVVRSGGFIPRFREVSIIFEAEGSANEVRPNGVTLDALLAIVSDHLSGLLSGSRRSMGKQLALEYIENARDVLAEEAQQSIHFEHTSPQFAHYGNGSL